jgi:hypothetical protein
VAGIVCWFFETSGYFVALTLAYLVRSKPENVAALFLTGECLIIFSFLLTFVKKMFTFARKLKTTSFL